MFAFDLIELNGTDLGDLPLIERKRRLARLFGRVRHAIRYSQHLVGDGPTVFEHACRMGLRASCRSEWTAPTPAGRRRRRSRRKTR